MQAPRHLHFALEQHWLRHKRILQMEAFMKIIKPSRAGSLESNDIMIMLHPREEGIEVKLDSAVMKQFGKRIHAVILETLESNDVTAVTVVARDNGALDYTIKARVTTAVYRGGSHD
jgi:citrate lyase subunit gamma (acyl carrier protein)